MVIRTFPILEILWKDNLKRQQTLRSLTLVEVKSSDGSLRGPSSPEQVLFLISFLFSLIFSIQVTDLSYEWEVKSSWDDGRDLKAREPYFSSGEYFKEGQSELQAGCCSYKIL